jgi:hypothetical protein
MRALDLCRINLSEQRVLSFPNLGAAAKLVTLGLFRISFLELSNSRSGEIRTRDPQSPRRIEPVHLTNGRV